MIRPNPSAYQDKSHFQFCRHAWPVNLSCVVASRHSWHSGCTKARHFKWISKNFAVQGSQPPLRPHPFPALIPPTLQPWLCPLPFIIVPVSFTAFLLRLLTICLHFCVFICHLCNSSHGVISVKFNRNKTWKMCSILHICWCETDKSFYAVYSSLY